MKSRTLAFAGVVLALAMVAQVATAQTQWAKGIHIVFFREDRKEEKPKLPSTT